MEQDLHYATNWSIKEGIFDHSSIAIMGGSYGGYSTQAGLTLTPGPFVCGVDLVGPSNLTSFLETVPPYGASEIYPHHKGWGPQGSGRERASGTDRLPRNYVDRIDKPLQIAQEVNDPITYPRANKNGPDRVTAAMHEKKIPVIYLLYSDEGHGFARPENRLSYYAVIDASLAEHLGGRCESAG